MNKEYLKIAIRSLRRSPVRSWLTMIGVVIGVFLIISLLSLSEGIKEAMLQQLNMMGKDLIIIMPGEINDMGWDLTEGQWPVVGKKELIVAKAVPEDLFPGMKVGDEVSIRGKNFRVAGILKSLGNKQDDSTITMDLDFFIEVTGEREGAKAVMAKVKPGYLVDDVVKNIEDNLNESRKRRRGEDLPSFSVLSSEKISDIVGNVMAIIQAAIFGFAYIAIIVGGIGIMNTMYTSVHERIREIGIMKAVGAKGRTITTIFLIESGFFGLFGGLGGIILGLGLAKLAEFAVQTTGPFYLKASITPQLILFSLAFSFLIGCIAGYLPSRSASKLKPVDALRY